MGKLHWPTRTIGICHQNPLTCDVLVRASPSIKLCTFKTIIHFPHDLKMFNWVKDYQKVIEALRYNQNIEV